MNDILSCFSGEDAPVPVHVHLNNASMIKMLTLTKTQQNSPYAMQCNAMLDASSFVDHFVHVCVGPLSPHSPHLTVNFISSFSQTPSILLVTHPTADT